MQVTLIPSVGGGIGHISRTATLARAMLRLDPDLSISFLLDAERLRPFNIGAAERTGFPVRVLPPRGRESRDDIVRHFLGEADLIVDDTMRTLIPYRHLVPRAAWVSIPLYPMGDELFLDWPHLAQTDGIVWAYAPFMEQPAELSIPAIASRVRATGPFLDVEDVPSKARVRRELGWDEGEEVVVYAPRGMPFGREFGETVLSGVYGGLEKLRAKGRKMRLVLLAVSDPKELRCPGFPSEVPGWVSIIGLVSPPESLRYTRAADIVIAEGTSTAHEAAALGTPVVMVPGAIRETWLLGTMLLKHRAARVLWVENVTPELMAQEFEDILSEDELRSAMIERARTVVTGGGGAPEAARFVLDCARRFREASSQL
jgi:glycosyltransferase involved in cell wall biosynthesis